MRLAGGYGRLPRWVGLAILAILALVVGANLFLGALDYELDRVDPSTTVTPHP
jgi:hypothetical protein